MSELSLVKRGGSSGKVAEGTFAGNDAVSITISGLGFKPKRVLIWCSNAGTKETLIVYTEKSGTQVGLYTDYYSILTNLWGLVYSTYNDDGFTTHLSGTKRFESGYTYCYRAFEN